MRLVRSMLVGCVAAMNAACGSNPPPVGPVPPVGPQSDGSVVRAVAVVHVSRDAPTFARHVWDLIIPPVCAATGSTVVTYNNAGVTSFALDTTAFTPGSFTGTTLSIGNVALSALDDNTLKVCGVGGNQKCLQAIIRVYTTGATAGFVHDVDGYGAPVYAGNLNPSTEVGLNTAGSVQVQVVSIAANKNRLRLSDLPSPTYPVSADFSNAGSGSYSMTFVVEYALSL